MKFSLVFFLKKLLADTNNKEWTTGVKVVIRD